MRIFALALRLLMRPRFATVLLLPLVFQGASAQSNPGVFAYVGKSYVLTAEVAGKHSFIVNLINLTDFVAVIQPGEFIYRGASGRYYIGQVFEQVNKDAHGETQKYSASFLLKGRSFTGLTIVGAFREQDQIEELSLRIGAKRFYLQSMQKPAFELLAAKVGDLDLAAPALDDTLQAAGMQEAGTVKTADGSAEWDRDWTDLITPDGINPPKIIERPDIDSTIEAKKARTFGKVKLSAIINKSGGIQEIKVVKGLGKGLDQRAIEGVANSWVFLPATKNGEVVETLISIDVNFPEPEKKP